MRLLLDRMRMCLCCAQITFDPGSALPVAQLTGVDPVASFDFRGKRLGFNSGVGIGSLMRNNASATEVRLRLPYLHLRSSTCAR